MNREVLAIYNTCDGHGVEHVQNALVNTLRIFIAALFSEVVLLGHYLRFMVAPQKDYICTILDFQGHQDYHDLDRIDSSVNVVSQEDEFSLEGKIVS